jgi:hypothetical protein
VVCNIEFRRLETLMLVWMLVLVVSLAQLGKQPDSKLQTLVSADGVFRFVYPRSYVLNTNENATEVGGSYIPVCSDGAACVVSRRSAYEGTNFQAASFQVREIEDATTKVACLRGPSENVPQFQIPKGDQKRIIGGVAFAHGETGEAGLGNFMSSDFYRAFHKRKCYELSVNIASSSFANFDPGTIKEFTHEDESRVRSDLMAILDSFRFLK